MTHPAGQGTRVTLATVPSNQQTSQLTAFDNWPLLYTQVMLDLCVSDLNVTPIDFGNSDLFADVKGC